MGTYTNQDCLTELAKVNTAKLNIKNAIVAKGVAVPDNTPLADYDDKIAAIATEKPEETFTITPTTSQQTVTPTAGSVFSSGTVNAVTAAIDANIIAGNIKDGVTILGVEGTYDNQKPEDTLTQTITSNGSQTFNPTSGHVFDKAVITTNVHPTDSLTKTYAANGQYSETGEWANATITVNVPEEKPEETLTQTITSNGSQTFNPTAGSVFDKAVITTNVHPTDSLTKSYTANGQYSETGEWANATITVNVQPDLQSKSAAPSTSSQTISPDEGYDGLSSVSISAVTAAIDANIAAGNIKDGVTILGVEGTFEGGKPEDSLTETITTNGVHAYSPTQGHVFSDATITVNVTPTISLQDKNVTPTTSQQSITADSGYDGLGTVGVGPVTAAIDANIQAANIKKDVSILGVVGTFEGGVTPTGTLNISANGTYDVTNYASAAVAVGGTDYRYKTGTADVAGLTELGWTSDEINYYSANMTPHYSWQNSEYAVSQGNKDLVGTITRANYKNYYNDSRLEYMPITVSISNISFQSMKYLKGIRGTASLNASYNCSQCFEGCTSLVTIPPINTRNTQNMYNMFNYCSSLTSIPQLDTSSVTNMSSMFNYCSSLTSIPQLDTSSVTNMSSMFIGCSSLTSIPALDTSSVTNMRSMFDGCSKLISIPQLNTSSVTNMSSMFNNCLNLATVNGIDFSGFTSNVTNLFGYTSAMSKITHFIVNGKINVSMSDNYSIKALIAIDYDSVKSILTAMSNTDTSTAKTMAFNRTMSDPDGELAALVADCSSAAKNWTITGLTLTA